jgi:hypothetical protein
MAQPRKAQKVIVRTYSAGVHYGTLASRKGQEVVLKNARRLWYWNGAFTLSAVATEGVKQGSKISVAVPEITLLQAIEIIPVSVAAAKNLDAHLAHTP